MKLSEECPFFIVQETSFLYDKMLRRDCTAEHRNYVAKATAYLVRASDKVLIEILISDLSVIDRLLNDCGIIFITTDICQNNGSQIGSGRQISHGNLGG